MKQRALNLQILSDQEVTKKLSEKFVMQYSLPKVVLQTKSKDNPMTTQKAPISLTQCAENVLAGNQFIRNRSYRTSQILVRYDVLMRKHLTDELREISQNRWVSYCVAEWAEVYPVPFISLSSLLKLAWREMQETGRVPSIEEMEDLLQITDKLSPIEQMVIVEEIESSH